MVSKWLITYTVLINGVYWGYSPLTNLLLTSWDILVPPEIAKQLLRFDGEFENFCCDRKKRSIGILHVTH